MDFRRFVPPGDRTGLADFSQQSTLVTGTASGASVEASFTVEQRKVVLSSPLRAFSINRKTGAFTGKINGSTKVLPFAGVFLGGGETAAHMIVNGETDTVTITP